MKRPFNAQTFLDSSGLARKITEYRRGDVVFAQGDACTHVLYIQKGSVKLSVLSKAGREAVVAMLGQGEFFGGKHDKPVRAVPPVSQETLAEMVGTTRSRVNFFMKKFQRLGFIDYANGLKVNNSLLTVVLHD